MHNRRSLAAGIYDEVPELWNRQDRLEINGAIREAIELTRGEAMKNDVSVQTELADGLPLIQGDRVQLQQVILNLIINAIEAMSGVSQGPRELLISSGKAESDGVLVAVRDSGPGLAPASVEHLFEAFYTTKPSGLGMGLSICRSIIEAHGGQLWATTNIPQGAIFQFTLTAHHTVHRDLAPSLREHQPAISNSTQRSTPTIRDDGRCTVTISTTWSPA
jgi:signal transduction histidine kinase